MIDHEYYSKIARGCLNFTTLKNVGGLTPSRASYLGETMLDLFVSDCLTPSWCRFNDVWSVGYFIPSDHEYKVWGALYGVVLHVQDEAVVITQTETDAHVCYIDPDRKEDGGYDFYTYEAELPLATIRKDLERGIKNVRRDKQIQDEIDELTR